MTNTSADVIRLLRIEIAALGLVAYGLSDTDSDLYGHVQRELDTYTPTVDELTGVLIVGLRLAGTGGVDAVRLRLNSLAEVLDALTARSDG